jgi:chaperonin GroES
MKKKLETPTCPIEPVGKHLFVKRLEAKTISSGGILLPDDAQEKPQYGKVLAIGQSVDPIYGVGAIVVFGKYAGADVDVLEKEPLVMLEKDEVIGVVRSPQLIKDLES